MSNLDRKFLASKKSLPSPNYNLEDAWKQYGFDYESPELFLEHVITELDKCKNDILHFAENYFYIISVDDGRKAIKLYDCQRGVIQNLVDNRFNVVAASRQVGKALDVDTLIPTPNGFVKMGDLKDGDYVLGVEGNPIKVLKAWDVLHDRKCYEVVFDNGERIVADENHNWFTQSRSERKINSIGSIKTTKEIKNKITYGKKTLEPNHRIPVPKPIKYETKKLTLSPYILGLWLGDGSTNASRIWCGPEDYDELKSLIQKEGIIVSDKAKNKNRYISLIGETPISDNCPIKILKKLNLYKNKHIPEDYLLSSIDQRKELLKGLMDTDGYVNERGTCQFYSSNKNLHEQVKTLLSSLGIKWSSTKKIPKIKDKSYSEHYMLTFKPEFECFKFKRKLKKQNLILKKVRNKFLYIKEVNEIESRAVRCITVDSEDNLFLCGKSYIPTHNTTITTIYVLWQALFNKDQSIFVLANKEETAKMILERIRLAYEEIPNWLKSSTVEFSKTTIKFDNGSKISTSTTSEQGIRGQSANIIVLDEFSFVRPEIASKFYEAVWPTISSSRTAKIIMLSTPNGASNIFYEMYSKAELGEGNKEWNGWQASKIMWDEIPRYNEKGELDYEGFKRAQIAGFGGNLDSWLQEFCCVFHDKGASTISMSLLQELKNKVKKPIYTFEDGDYLVWEDRQPGHIYSIGVDTSEGVGKDYSVAQILDITDLTDIRLVGQYHSNMLQPYVFAEKINRLARGWGRPFLAIERNGPGGQVIDALKEIHQYDNIIHYAMKNDKRGMYQKSGIFCHQNSKYTGIMNMKYWVENLRAVTIPDANTLREYETFRRMDNGTWRAKDGHFDDRIMSIIWALIPLETEIAQRYFSILQYDDIGKPKLIKDPNAEYTDMFGPLWDTTNSSLNTARLGDPPFSGFGNILHDIKDAYKTNDKGSLDIGVQGWTIL